MAIPIAKGLGESDSRLTEEFEVEPHLEGLVGVTVMVSEDFVSEVETANTVARHWRRDLDKYITLAVPNRHGEVRWIGECNGSHAQIDARRLQQTIGNGDQHMQVSVPVWFGLTDR